MKSIVVKLSGFAKFELDHKLGFEQFQGIVMKLSNIKEQTAELKESIKSMDQKSERTLTGSVAGSFPTGLVFSKDRLD